MQKKYAGMPSRAKDHGIDTSQTIETLKLMETINVITIENLIMGRQINPFAVDAKFHL